MSTSTPQNEITFQKVGPNILLFTPPSHTAGELVIICSWLGAARKHIAKYTDGYRKVAPNAKILLIQSSVGVITSTYATQLKAIQPAVQVVRATLDESGHGTIGKIKIVIHTFSNGGINSATQLLIALHKQLATPLPLHAIICDSGPAIGTYWKSYKGMTISLPKGFLWQLLGPVVVHAILIVLYSSIAIGRYEKPEDLWRRTLLDENITDSKTISYIYSRADKVTDWTDITSHADVARQKGWDIHEVVFEDTDHVNHLGKHGEEYFQAVERVWRGDQNRSPRL